MNSRGLTIIETLIVMGVVSILSSLIFGIFANQYQMFGQIDHRQKLIALLEENVIEIRTQPISSLPDTGKCKFRIYDLNGNYQTEGVADLSSALCIDDATDKIKIIMKVTKAANANVTFNPAQFLRIPSKVDTVKQIQLVGFIESEKFDKQLSLTIFKR